MRNTAPTYSYGCNLLYGEKARRELTERSQYISKIVGRTMGPYGSPAMLDRQDAVPTLTKDGVTVLYDLAKYDDSTFEEDHIYNVVYEIIRGVSETISKHTGDGTSTVTWLISQFMTRLSKAFNADLEPRKVIEGFNKAIQEVVARLQNATTVAEDEETLEAVLYTSANGNKEIIDTLIDVFLEIGDEGMIFIRDAHATHTKVYFEEGMDIPIKLDTPEVVDPDSMRIELEDPYVLVCLDPIASPYDLIPVLEDVVTRGTTQDLVIAYSEMADSVKDLIHKNNNSKESKLRIVSFRMPMYTDRQRDYLLDIAAATSSTAIDKTMGLKLKDCTIAELGSAHYTNAHDTMVSITNGKGSTDILDDGRTVLQKRIDEVTMTRDTFTGNIEERNRYNERIAKLTGTVVSICPGAHSRTEIIEKKGSYEDAIKAGQRAITYGIVPGGGYFWYTMANEMIAALESTDLDYVTGYRAALLGLASVFEKLTDDAGVTTYETDKLCRAAADGKDLTNYNIDLRTMKAGHFLETRVIDPAVLQEDIITQAASVATTLMNTTCVVTIEPTEEFKKYKEVQRFQHLRV